MVALNNSLPFTAFKIYENYIYFYKLETSAIKCAPKSLYLGPTVFSFNAVCIILYSYCYSPKKKLAKFM